MSNINSLFKKFLACCMLLMICTAQPAEANRWRYLIPLSRSIQHVKNQPRVSHSSSDDPWNFIIPCVLLAGGGYLLWLFKKDGNQKTALPPRNQQTSKQREIILANYGGVLLL